MNNRKQGSWCHCRVVYHIFLLSKIDGVSNKILRSLGGVEGMPQREAVGGIREEPKLD